MRELYEEGQEVALLGGRKQDSCNMDRILFWRKRKNGTIAGKIMLLGNED